MLGQLYRPIGLIACLVLLGACSTTHETAGEAPAPPPKPRPKTEMKAPLAVYEATLRPSLYDEEVDVVQQAHKEEQERRGLEVGRDSLVVEEEVSQGYRVQIFSTSNIDEANAMRASVQQMLASDTVYVVYDPPVYKVRVGDYVSRLEANRMLTFMLDRGFRDAWVVADRITRRKIVRPTPTQQVKPD